LFDIDLTNFFGEEPNRDGGHKRQAIEGPSTIGEPEKMNEITKKYREITDSEGPISSLGQSRMLEAIRHEGMKKKQKKNVHLGAISRLFCTDFIERNY